MDMDGTTSVFKKHETAWNTCAGKEFENWALKHITPNTRILLVHTRSATKGNPMMNENNHPLTAEPSEGIIIHNGSVRNDDQLFATNKELVAFQRSCQTDSDVFRAMVDDYGGIDKGLIKAMGIADGVAAVAAIHPATPDKLLLLRDCNPLVIGATKHQMIFASDKVAIYRSIKPWVKLHNIPMQVHAPDLSFTSVPNETGWIIGPNGFETHDVFKCNGKMVGGYTRYSKTTQWHSRRRAFEASAAAELAKKQPSAASKSPAGPLLPKKVEVLHNEPVGDTDLPDFVICPDGSCSAHVALKAEERRKGSLAELACKLCGSNLAGAITASPFTN